VIHRPRVNHTRYDSFQILEIWRFNLDGILALDLIRALVPLAGD
jgi:hypothetical protein